MAHRDLERARTERTLSSLPLAEAREHGKERASLAAQRIEYESRGPVLVPG
jgi:hypothetical protein